jgi:dTDP-3,4-didehydro-2,6-dideoxy-alpha-D-glucose 3-reductase
MGCAAIARRSVIPAVKALPKHFELIATASRTGAKAEAFALQFGCEALIGYERLLERPDIDAIYMPLPTGLHEEWVLRSLEAGKHVLIEKSLAMNLPSAERMIAKARERNLLAMENFMFCHHSQHQFVRQLLGDGQIGDLRLMRSSFGFPPLAKNNFRYDKTLGGGALLDAGAYTLKATQMILGPQVQVLGAHLDIDSAQGVDVGGGAMLRNAAGAVSQVAFGFDNFYQCNYEIWGSLGKITVERAFTPPPTFSPKVILERQGEREEFNLSPDNHFGNILLEFARSVSEHAFQPHWDACLNQARLIQGIVDSC